MYPARITVPSAFELIANTRALHSERETMGCWRNKCTLSDSGRKALGTNGIGVVSGRRRNVQTRVDDEERQALRAEGFDPDDPAVVAAIDMVRWELSLLSQS